MIAIEPMTDLVFVYMPDCQACTEAEPEIDKYAAQNPRAMIVKIRADGPLAQRLVGKRIKVTPTYVLRHGGEGIVHEGAMKAKEIGQWIDGAIRSDEIEE